MTENVKFKGRNFVSITGYLKENTLDTFTTKDGQPCIKGSLVIATSEIDAHKVSFYVTKFDKNHQPNKNYNDLEALLPLQTNTIGNFIKANPNATFQMAMGQATKVFVRAKFEEYASKIDNNERSMILLKGFSAKVKTVSDTQQFTPAATFSVDVYIDKIVEETKHNKETESLEPTGRLILQCFLPQYDGRMDKINFIVPTDDNKAEFIRNNYTVGNTANFTGKIINITQEVESDAPIVEDSFAWGATTQKQIKTTFTRERIILGREYGKIPLEEGMSGAITKDMIKKGLVIRDEHIADNTANRANRGNNKAKVGMNMNFGNTPQTTTQSTPQTLNADKFDIDF